MNSKTKCKLCGYKQSQIDIMQTHYFSKHFFCVKCERQFKDKAEIFEHAKSFHQLDVQCQICPFNSFHKGFLKRHRMIHSKNASHISIDEYLSCKGKYFSERAEVTSGQSLGGLGQSF